MVHDLRSPLAAIQMALEVVRLSHTENSEVERAFGVMERQVGDLARLIGDLLDLTRVTKGKIKLRAEWVDLSAVIDHAVEACHPLITQKRHQLTVSLPPEPTRVRADGPRLQQVLINLLNNAAKYTDLGGHIWLTAEAAPGTQIVRVRDNGRGIAPDLLPRIFDLFQQGPENQGLGGLGIGLALVKWLVELHGGTVCAHSDGLDKGSEFVVRLHAPVIRV
jgi:signal transduction histidine kinase